MFYNSSFKLAQVRAKIKKARREQMWKNFQENFFDYVCQVFLILEGIGIIYFLVQVIKSIKNF